MFRPLQLPALLLSAMLLTACGVDPSLINGDDVSPVFIFAGQMAEGSASATDPAPPGRPTRNAPLAAAPAPRPQPGQPAIMAQNFNYAPPLNPPAPLPAPNSCPIETPY